MNYMEPELYAIFLEKCGVEPKQAFFEKLDRAMKKELLAQMELIGSFCKASGIRHAFLKGYIEAHDLYLKQSDREFSDIDILVETKNIEALVSFLLHQGYKAAIDLSDPIILKEQLRTTAFHHLIPLKKQLSYGQIITIEIHMVLAAQWYKIQAAEKMNLTELMLSHTAEYDMNGFRFDALDVEDRYIVALQHFSRHLISDISRIAYYKDIKCLFHLKTLLDAVLIWFKYKEKLNCDTLRQRIQIYGFRDSVKLACKFIRLYFDIEIFSDAFFDDTTVYRYNYWELHIYKQLIENLTKEIIVEKRYIEYYKSVISGCIHGNVSYRCSKQYSRLPIEINNDKDSLTKDRFSSIYRQHPLQEVNKIAAKVYIKYDAQYLYFEIHVTDRQLKLVGGPNKWSDAVILYLYNPCFTVDKNNAVTAIMLCPSIDQANNIYVSACYCGEGCDVKNGKAYHLESGAGKINVSNLGYKLDVKLSWEKLNFDMEQLSYCGLDIAVNNVDGNEEKTDAEICWSNPTRSY